jgi:type I restriction enzyme S subunit
MKFKTEPLGKFFTLQKGLGYKGENLVTESDVGLITIDSFQPGGGYKRGSEKPFSGPFKSSFSLAAGDLLFATTDITQDGSILCAPLLIPNSETGFDELIYSLDVAKAEVLEEGLSPEFVYNFFRVSLNRYRAAYGDTGTTVRRISFDVLYEQQIPVPSIEEQDRINNLISTFDRKIQLNITKEETLEKIAESIFRSWFVDFDPVIAKIAGEKPAGMDDATATLFPDSMEDSELGAIPMGWCISTVQEFAPFIYGKALKAGLRQSGIVPVYGSNGVVGLHNDSLTKSSSVIIGRKGTVGTVNLCLQPAWIIDTAFFAVPAEATDVFLAYFSLKSLGLENMNSDGAVPGLNRDEAHGQKIVVADRATREKFGEVAESLFVQVRTLQEQTAALLKLRDALLPRLISGELQIPEEMLAM